MKKNIAFLLSILCCQLSRAQLSEQVKMDTALETVKYLNARVSDLFEAGVETKNDSLIIKEEVFRLLRDSQYCKSVYPEKYEWPSAIMLMKVMELKKAFWHFINLYHSNPASRDLIIHAYRPHHRRIRPHRLRGRTLLRQ